MAKNARWGTASAGPMIVQASNSLKAHELFGGKTLDAIGGEFDLADEDVRFAFTELKDGTEIKHLAITVDGAKYIIPFSRGAKADEIPSLGKCMQWMFRTGFMSEKDDDGTPLLDENDNIILNESKPYMSFGLPGLNITREADAWEEPDEADLSADTTVGAKTGTVKTEDKAVLTPKQKADAAKARAAAAKPK